MAGQSLSIGKAWDEARVFVRDEGPLLFPVAFALLALPSITVQYFMPASRTAGQVEPGGWMWLLLPYLALTIVGSLTISAMALRPGSVVGDALADATRRAPVLFGAILIFAAVIGILAFFVAIPLSFILAGQPPSVAAGVGMLALMPVLLVALVRMVLLYAVAVRERVGPVELLKRPTVIRKKKPAKKKPQSLTEGL